MGYPLPSFGKASIQTNKQISFIFFRYGGQAANFTADDLTQSPGEEDIDLQDLMRKLSSTDYTESSQKTEQAVVQEDGDNRYCHLLFQNFTTRG